GDIEQGIGSRRNWRHVARRVDRNSVELEHLLAENIVGLRMLRKRDGWLPCSHDAVFFSGDSSDCVTEELLMIEIDIGDHRDQRLDNVRCVEATAHAY